ncbi:14-3-3 protein, partial [Aulographum hederae CBS 113979]
MATSDIDQKTLGRLAYSTSAVAPLLSSNLYRLLGLSVLLSKRLLRARKLRKLDTSRDTKSLQLYHHILWLSREGLQMLETYILPYTTTHDRHPELKVLSAKLRASFYHIFCLFHNQPPISQSTIPAHPPPTFGVPLSAEPYLVPKPLTPRPGKPHVSRSGKERAAVLRDTIPSMTSEASYITNPYATGGPVGTPSPAPPPGFAPLPPQPPDPGNSIIPAQNFLPATSAYFLHASNLASNLLPGSHPLRLSVMLEYSMFLWDCLLEAETSRTLAKKAIRDCKRAGEGLSEESFEDARDLVGSLGRVMRRKSWESTPRVGAVGVEQALN